MMSQIKKERILVDMIILCGIFLLPTYISILIAFIFAFRYRNYFELPLLSFIIDVVYNSDKSVYFGLFGFSIIAVLLIEFFRGRIKEKSKDTLY